MNSNIDGRFLWQKIPLGTMGIMMAHNPNMAIVQLGQPMRLLRLSNVWLHDNDDVMFWVVSCIDVLGCEGRWVVRKRVLKGNLLEMTSNWQISIWYEDNQIMTERSLHEHMSSWARAWDQMMRRDYHCAKVAVRRPLSGSVPSDWQVPNNIHYVVFILTLISWC